MRMGHQNAALALLIDCPPSTKVVLFTMALHSLDPDKGVVDPLHYYGGWHKLAMSLGFHEYTPSAERAVARAIAQLVDKGVVKPVDYSRAGSRVYQLHLSPMSGAT